MRHRRLTKAEMLARNPIRKAISDATPLSPQDIRDMNIAANVSLDEALAGRAKVQHRDALVEVVNLVTMLTEKFSDEEGNTLARRAAEAILRADARHADGKNWALDGEGISAVKDAIAAQDQAMHSLSKWDVVDGILEADRRLKSGRTHSLEAA